MILLDRYIAKTILGSIGFVALALAGLQFFILFVNQLDELGHGDYGIVQALLFVSLQTPYQVYLFLPMASLLGSLIGLGVMANHRELVVMRAAGMSITHITGAVLKVALLLTVIITVLSETLVPQLSHFANDQKMQALSGGQMLRTAKGVWLRYHNDFITIDTVLPGNILLNVSQFRFNTTHHMVFARHSDRIVFHKGAWHAYQIDETYFSPTATYSKSITDMPWDVLVKPSIISVSSSEPDEMTLLELRRYLRVVHRSHQSAIPYQLSYWQRVVQPLTTIVMMLLAVPFIFGPLRSSTMGSKLLIGATVGFGFHIVNRFFGPVSQVMQWPPILAALGPTLVFAAVGIYLMRRVK